MTVRTVTLHGPALLALLGTPDHPLISAATAAGIDIAALVGRELGVRIEPEGASQFVAGLPGERQIDGVAA